MSPRNALSFMLAMMVPVVGYLLFRHDQRIVGFLAVVLLAALYMELNDRR